MDQTLQGPTGGALTEPVAVSDRLPELRGMFERILCVARSSDQKPIGNIELADRLIKAVVSWGASGAALAQPEPEGAGPTLRAALKATAEQRRAEDDARADLAAKPVGEELTDEELFRIASDCAALYIADDGDYDNCSEVVAAMRGAIAAALARYGHQPAPPPAGADGELVAWLAGLAVRAADCRQPKAAGMLTWAAQVVGEHADPVDRQAAPVPVSERLPGPEDCDADGRCWLLTVEDGYPQWRLHSIEGNQPGELTMIWVPVDSSPGVMVDAFYASHWLPFTALPLPSGEVEK